MTLTMAKRARICVVERCGNRARDGLKVCATHEHVQALQSAYQRERSASPVGAWALLRFAPVRELIQLLAELDDLATPLKGANTEVVSRDHSHNVGDNIAVLGDVATLAQGVSTYRDRGRLGAAVSVVAEATSKVKHIADPKAGPTTRKCRSRACPKPDHHQPLDARYCAWCGKEFRNRA